MKVNLNGFPVDFDGDCLLVPTELEVSVSYDNNSDTYDVYLGDINITGSIQEPEMDSLRDLFDEAAAQYYTDEAAPKGYCDYDHTFDEHGNLVKDRKLSEIN